MPTRPELVQFGDLTPSHFDRHPVWIACHIADYDEPWYDDTDEETFRPWAGTLPVGGVSDAVCRAAWVGNWNCRRDHRRVLYAGKEVARRDNAVKAVRF